MPLAKPRSAPKAIVTKIARTQFIPTHSLETRTMTTVAQRLMSPPTDRS